MCQKIYIIDSKGSYTILLSQYSWSRTTFTYFTPELAEYTTRLNLQINNTAINMSHILKIPIHTPQALSITHKTISTINKLQCTYSTFLKSIAKKTTALNYYTTNNRMHRNFTLINIKQNAYILPRPLHTWVARTTLKINTSMSTLHRTHHHFLLIVGRTSMTLHTSSFTHISVHSWRFWSYRQTSGRWHCGDGHFSS